MKVAILNRLVGFSRQEPTKPEVFIDTDLGVCVHVGSEAVDKLIGGGSPGYALWRDCWNRTQAVLYKRR
jgi:hypothetical protein